MSKSSERKRWVNTHDSSGFEHLQNLTINALETRGVDGGFDGIDRVEAVLAKDLRELHEVALDEGDLVGKARPGRVPPRAPDLEIVVVEPDDGHVRETSDLARRAPDTAPDVQDAHSRLEVHLAGEVVFVASNLHQRKKWSIWNHILEGVREGGGGLPITYRLVEAFALVETGKVEAATPSPLVELRSTVVIPVHDVFIVRISVVGVDLEERFAVSLCLEISSKWSPQPWNSSSGLFASA